MYAIGQRDVWAVGEGYYAFASNATTPIILHWNGLRWDWVPNPKSFTVGVGLYNPQISADSASDVWVALAGDGVLRLARWNGSAWVADIRANGYGIITALRVFAPSDAWFSVLEPKAVYRWNGASLTKQFLPAPIVNTAPFDLYTLAGTAADDLWTGGSDQYIALHTASFARYATIGANVITNIIDFRKGYVVATNDADDRSTLLVYNGYVRWRPTTSPFGTYAVAPGASPVRGTTSFWAEVYHAQTEEPYVPALITCPANPPAPL